MKNHSEALSGHCVTFLLKDESLKPYRHSLKTISEQVEHVSLGTDAKHISETIDSVASDLELLTEIVSNLKIDDPNKTTQIIDAISELYSEMNQLRTQLKKRYKDIVGTEARAEFNSQLKLLDQTIANYLVLCETPEKCEEYLTKLMVQIEELEAKFSEFDEFILQLVEKRERVYSTIEAKKIQLLEQRNKRSVKLSEAADRILNGIKTKAHTLKSVSEINSYFATDLMIEKVRDIISSLIELDDSVKADDIETRLKTIQEEAVNQLKDKNELYVDGKNIIKFGEHQFSVNMQALDGILVHKNSRMYFHITGTDFFEEINDERLEKTRPVWEQHLPSENNDVYRAEFLAYAMFEQYKNANTLYQLEKLSENELYTYVQKELALRLDEGYSKGIHDTDAARILHALLKMYKGSGLLRYSPHVRAVGIIGWCAFLSDEVTQQFRHRFTGLRSIAELFPNSSEWEGHIRDIKNALRSSTEFLALSEHVSITEVAEYLFFEMLKDEGFVHSQEAHRLLSGFQGFLAREKCKMQFDTMLQTLSTDPLGKLSSIKSWVNAYHEAHSDVDSDYVSEVIALLFSETYSTSNVVHTALSVQLTEMKGDHERIKKDRKSVV